MRHRPKDTTVLPGPGESHLLNPEDGPPIISIWDDTNPCAIVNLLPDNFSKHIKEHAERNPDLFQMDEHELYKFLVSNTARPNPTDNRLRLRFWLEYERTLSNGNPKMSVRNVLGGVISETTFYTKYMKRPFRMAWMLTPPTNYVVKMEEALEFGTEQMRDVLERSHVIPPSAPGGQEKIDYKLLEMKFKIWKVLDDRVKGGVVQRQVQVQVSARADSRDAKKFMENMSSVEVEHKLKQLEAREREALHLPGAHSEDIISPELLPVVIEVPDESV